MSKIIGAKPIELTPQERLNLAWREMMKGAITEADLDAIAAEVPPSRFCEEPTCLNEMWPKDDPQGPRYCPDHNELNP